MKKFVHTLSPESFAHFLDVPDDSFPALRFFAYNPYNSHNLYEILGLKLDATMEEISIACKREALLYHPYNNLYVEDTKKEKIIPLFTRYACNYSITQYRKTKQISSTCQ
jgi:hypothetical protein